MALADASHAAVLEIARGEPAADAVGEKLIVSNMTDFAAAIAALGSTAAPLVAPVLSGSVKFERTVTAALTVGAQTINKPSGTVNFAALAVSLVVTNSLVTVNSIIHAVVRTVDATATGIASVVPGVGSFTITLNAAATAETSVGFLVTN